MTANTQRWKRILKVRAVQRQMAEVQLYRCEAEVRNLVDLGARISAIRNAAQAPTGGHDGVMLQSVCELSSRLDSAHRALVTPSQNATEARDRQQRVVTAAKQREMAVEKLEATMVAHDAKCAVGRQSRAAIFRKPTKLEGMS